MCVAGLNILTAYCVSFYKISRERHEEVMTALEEGYKGASSFNRMIKSTAFNIFFLFQIAQIILYLFPFPAAKFEVYRIDQCS